MLATTVSSKILKAFARLEGFHFEVCYSPLSLRERLRCGYISQLLISWRDPIRRIKTKPQLIVFISDQKGNTDFSTSARTLCDVLPIPQETLPGFKWIGKRIHELSKTGKEVIFAFEESIGKQTALLQFSVVSTVEYTRVFLFSKWCFIFYIGLCVLALLYCKRRSYLKNVNTFSFLHIVIVTTHLAAAAFMKLPLCCLCFVCYVHQGSCVAVWCQIKMV